MAVRVAINGFGRIGRLVLRAAAEQHRKDIQFVAINDLGSVEANAHLFRYDSVHGPFPGKVKTGKDWLDVGDGEIRILAEKDPTKLPWKALDIDIVLECTGIFTDKDKAQVHLAAGAKRVLVSAPSTGADMTVVYGVNEDKLSANHLIVSNASCTTNCLAPVAAVLHKEVGIKHGFMTTVHSYTGDQRTVDTLHKDFRRARAAAMSLIPSSSGAARAIGLVLPELKGKLDGTSIRVPTPNVSVVDLVIEAERATTPQAINAAVIKAAGDNRLKGILVASNEPLVSSDFNHTSASSIVDLLETQVIDGTCVRILSWYDNEWGFSCRMNDTAVAMGRLI